MGLAELAASAASPTSGGYGEVLGVLERIREAAANVEALVALLEGMARAGYGEAEAVPVAYSVDLSIYYGEPMGRYYVVLLATAIRGAAESLREQLLSGVRGCFERVVDVVEG